MPEKTVFITGGSGFIGKNLVESLRQTMTVHAPSHADLDLLSQDAVSKFFKEHDIDYVIHCANVGGNRKCPGPVDSVGRNTRIFFNLVENSQYYEKLVHLGSGAEYDKNRPLFRIGEDALGESIPQDDYGFSKYLISKYIEKTENCVCLRLFGVFGRYEDYEYKFISNALLKNYLKMPISIRQNVLFDWLYIDDLTKIISCFLGRNTHYRAYNITPGQPIDLISISKMINDGSPFKSEIIVENPGMNHEYSGNNERLITEIGGFRFTPFSDALSALRSYYASIMPRIDADAIRRDEFARYCVIRKDA